MDFDEFDARMRVFETSHDHCFLPGIFIVARLDGRNFTCRISQLPNLEFVQDYFLWRAEDAHRNALNTHCYWRLRMDGKTNRGATQLLAGMSVTDKNELLFRHGINYNDLPAWQKRGVGLIWETYQKTGRDPRTDQEVITSRSRIRVILDLPIKEAYSRFIEEIIHTSQA